MSRQPNIGERDIPMNTYLLVHRHPENYTGTADTFAAWKVWFKQLGSQLVDLRQPGLRADTRRHPWKSTAAGWLHTHHGQRLH
jgi:hypothetical protein